MKVTITTYTSGQASSIVTQAFTYDADGIKVTQTETVDSDADGTVDSTTSTEYLNDKQNLTGYSQVVEERVDDGTGTRTTTYTIGHDVIAQFSAAVGALVLLTDAHGSTRAVADAAAQVQQEYLYDAYGSLLNMQPANALTSLLYSGEQFNPVAGLQYLRARWYDPSIGRFTRMDPYSGNVQDPLGLHKYTYANGNPVLGVDPSGLLGVFSLGDVLIGAAIMATLNGGISAALSSREGMKGAIGAFVAAWTATFVGISLTGAAAFYAPGLNPYAVSAFSFGFGAALGTFLDILIVDSGEPVWTLKHVAEMAVAFIVGAGVGIIAGNSPTAIAGRVGKQFAMLWKGTLCGGAKSALQSGVWTTSETAQLNVFVNDPGRAWRAIGAGAARDILTPAKVIRAAAGLVCLAQVWNQKDAEACSPLVRWVAGMLCKLVGFDLGDLRTDDLPQLP